MSALIEPKPEDEAQRLEAATDQAIAACGGDMRGALKAALIAMTMLEDELSDVYAAASKGYARGRIKENRDG